MAIAILLSVTVSIAAETIGTFIFKFLEKFDERSTFAGRTSENAGTSKTSSNVRPSEKISVIDLFIAIKN